MKSFISGVTTLLRKAGDVIRGIQRIEVTEDRADVLVTLHRSGETRFETRAGQIFQNEKVLGRFSDASVVEIARVDDGDSSPCYRIAIRMRNGSTIQVGLISDEVDASILAAKISKMLGLNVKSLVFKTRSVL